MFNQVLTSTSCLIVIAMFSLAWFIVGVSAGKHQAPAPKPPPARKRGGKGKPKQQKKKPQQASSELYVGNLSYDVNDKELRRAFDKHGTVRDVRIIENRFNGKSKGFAFVDMADESDARAAIKALNGQELDGRKMVVNFARTRPKD